MLDIQTVPLLSFEGDLIKSSYSVTDGEAIHKPNEKEQKHGDTLQKLLEWTQRWKKKKKVVIAQ